MNTFGCESLKQCKSSVRILTERPKSSYASLERMVNKTTLTVQRVTHNDILDQGEKVLNRSTMEEIGDIEKSLKNEIDQVERRCARELQIALSHQKKRLMEERTLEMMKQKQYYERHMSRVEQVRDKAEKERADELHRLNEEAIKEALIKQKEELKLEQEDAVKKAIMKEREVHSSRVEAEKKEAIEKALLEAEKKFIELEKKAREDTRADCEKMLTEILRKERKTHQSKLASLVSIYRHLYSQFMKAINHYREVEEDFLSLQEDYKRFMDHTEGHFHSDYLMKLRSHGLIMSDKEHSDVEYEPVMNTAEFTRNAFE